jgi:hypothetical protein
MRGDFASQAIETACSAGFADFCIGKGEVHHPEGCDIEKLPATPDVSDTRPAPPRAQHCYIVALLESTRGGAALTRLPTCAR